MTAILSFYLEPDVVLKVRGRRQIPRDVRNEIDRVWDDRLVDGEVLSIVSYSPSLICGEIVPFRALHASRLIPLQLFLHPLGVSGRVRYRDAVLLGKRAKHLSLFPGSFECCPSGHVDLQHMNPDGMIDMRKIFFQELEEETTISRTSIYTFQFKSLCYSIKDGTWDVVSDILLSTLPQKLEATEEYDEFCWLTANEVEQFLTQKSVVPLSEWILRHQ